MFWKIVGSNSILPLQMMPQVRRTTTVGQLFRILTIFELSAPLIIPLEAIFRGYVLGGAEIQSTLEVMLRFCKGFVDALEDYRATNRTLSSKKGHINPRLRLHAYIRAKSKPSGR